MEKNCMSKRILIPLADGFEEIEAVTVVDILRRAGADVVTAGLQKRNVTGSHNLHLVADTVLEECLTETWDAIILPGGVPGTPNLAEDSRLIDLLQKQGAANQVTAALCAAPYVLDRAGLTRQKRFTSHPNWVEKIQAGDNTQHRVMIDGNLITGQAAGSAMEFAFLIVESLFGPETADAVNQGVLARR
ncbi:MAG: DJ-1/PfpI family protein [Candidatus Neomarinimicrobiota bacterium]|nr:MAG: DJ-1/PfpI family protein [Candidatus Neomarinimicrobiota bacterium]